MRARSLLLLALLAVVFLAACTSGGRRLTEDERDRRSESTIDSMSD